MSEEMLDVAGYASPVEGLGPGRRLILWVRGCAARCPGCLSPELWEAGSPTPVAQVAAEIAPRLAGLDGLSISGGEPFDQPRALAALITLLRQAGLLEVLVYTGYTLEALQARPDAAELLAVIDLLIDGRYREELPNTLQWRGSDNQRIHLLSPQAQRHAAGKDDPMPEQRPLQLQPLDSRRFRIIGIPRRGDMERYQELMARLGIGVEVEKTGVSQNAK